jgi:hypothetical protein
LNYKTSDEDGAQNRSEKSFRSEHESYIEMLDVVFSPYLLMPFKLRTMEDSHDERID